MSAVKAEKANAGDAEELARLEAAYIPCPWSKEQLMSALSDERYSLFAVRVGGKAVSYGGACFALDEAEICNVVTDEKFRGKGFAEEILSAILSECESKGIKKVFLEVAYDNIPAKNLYAKKGFCKIAVRNNYYGLGKAAEIMRKEIR